MNRKIKTFLGFTLEWISFFLLGFFVASRQLFIGMICFVDGMLMAYVVGLLIKKEAINNNKVKGGHN